MQNKPNTDEPLHMFNEEAIAAAPVKHDPYDFCFIDNVLAPDMKQEVLADCPNIPDRGSYGLPSLQYGQKFDACMKDLQSPRFKRLVEKKFNMDLRPYPTSIVMMGNTSGRYNEGYAHTDSKHKIVTVLVGFSEEWPYEKGKLRVLRSNNRNDYAFEFAPVYGNMLMFRVSDHSWHGFLPQKGRRMSVQLCYVDSKLYPICENVRHAVSAFVKSIPGAKQIIDWAPRSWGNKG